MTLSPWLWVPSAVIGAVIVWTVTALLNRFLTYLDEAKRELDRMLWLEKNGLPVCMDREHIRNWHSEGCLALLKDSKLYRFVGPFKSDWHDPRNEATWTTHGDWAPISFSDAIDQAIAKSAAESDAREQFAAIANRPL